MKEKSSNKLTVEHLNINSIRNKFEFLEDVINRNVDITLYPSVRFILKFLFAKMYFKIHQTQI